ncbi:hypothetical protein AOQ84DRAFT_287503 [Glonium stellatum]|uniref:Uncharacterized protein n=1 Tax=Glonium stellatum TaxID=574774 RepID=A0A8E2JVS1_9PEZI|nr:hypothetical protein AOQ84DRAFT_287503 [Glonium stellatum]
MSSRSFSVSVASPAAAQSGKKQGLSTDDSVKTGRYPDDQHATRQSSSENVMSSSVQQGISDRKKGTGGNATEEKDSAGSTQKAKQEHPEAPDVVIGMQDERGGKGA